MYHYKRDILMSENLRKRFYIKFWYFDCSYRKSMTDFG